MAHGNNNNNKFLTIPSEEGLFRTVRVERSGEENGDDEEEEEAEEDVRFIPRCSPVPRKRGPSIADETAEYMRIRFSLPNRRVSFADSTGAELVDVRMFVAFDSEEDEESRWEEEEARYRKAYREPTYRVCPEFQPFTGTELMLSVNTNKLEVESVTSDPNEPLSFDVVVRVLNISFHKSVYVRSTMDGWITHFDYPAEYVQGSNDGETDKFTVKLSFASPYLFNGARIDFVVRYETSDGEFWANNSGKNYAVTLSQSIEEDTTQYVNAEDPGLRGILKPPRFRTNNDDDDEFYDDKEDDDLSSENYESAKNKTCYAQPTIVQPEIDIETAKNLSSSPESTEECHLSTTDSPSGEPLTSDSTLSNNSPQAESETADETVQTSILHEPESHQSTSEFSDSQVHVFNVVPSTSLHSVFDDNYEFEDSNFPQKDDFKLEIAAQVPFEFAQPSPGGFSDQLYFQEVDDLNEKKDVEEIDGTEVDELEDQCPDLNEKKDVEEIDGTEVDELEDQCPDLNEKKDVEEIDGTEVDELEDQCPDLNEKKNVEEIDGTEVDELEDQCPDLNEKKDVEEIDGTEVDELEDQCPDLNEKKDVEEIDGTEVDELEDQCPDLNEKKDVEEIDGTEVDELEDQCPDLNEKKDVEEIDGTEVDELEDQCPDIKEETETYFHVLDKSVQLENNDHASEDVEHHMAVDSLPEGLQHHLEKETEEQEVDLLSLVTAETVEEMLTLDSIRKGGEEIDGLVASCLGVTTRQDIETHSSLIYPPAETSDHDLTTMQEEVPVMETGEDPDYIKPSILMSTSDHQTTVQGKSEPSHISEAPFIAPEFAGDLQPSTLSSAIEEDLTCHKSCQGDEISAVAYQTHKDSEIKLPLPTESSEISKNETLQKSMIASMTFFSAAVCLAVGIQEPSIFLVVGLFLLSLCI
ncbi:uncharacterized protein ppp1r3f isoform X2 [Paramisgurnus dabryanus]|uniref:uncharacterized protein ppp1r3f isoform X2 n=1 Tax=Paramisgurnus dabryanus TaxID=90735 RepID=UPI0031F36B15